MLQAKLILFTSALIVVFGASDVLSVDNVDVKRSAVCLINGVAQHNKIRAVFTKVSVEQHDDTTHVKSKLELGTEQYLAEATSLQKAKENVAREAYAKTHYQKPALHNRTCIVHLPTAKSDISLLSEYGQAVHTFASFEEKPHDANNKFVMSASLGGQSALGTSNETKKKAKAAAATNLIEKIGRNTVITKLESKWNNTGFHGMDPLERLRKIIRVTDLSDDGIVSTQVSSELKAGKQTIIAKIEAKDSEVTGSGATLEEAKKDAAARLLRNLGFIVNYPPKA